MAENGDLCDFIVHSGIFSEKLARTYFHQIISGLECLHKNNIAHRDMKPENLLFDNNFNLKIADFGFSTHMDRKLQTYCGTKIYMAPEILTHKPYSGVSVDLFAAGVILLNMLTGFCHYQSFQRPPFTEQFYANSEEFWKHLGTKLPFSISEDFKDLINGILAYYPDNRLNLDQIKEHPWFIGPCATGEEIKIEFTERYEKVNLAKMKKRGEKD